MTDRLFTERTCQICKTDCNQSSHARPLPRDGNELNGEELRTLETAMKFEGEIGAEVARLGRKDGKR